MRAFLEAGRVVGTHGLRGELRFEPWCDGPEVVGALKTLYELDGDTPSARYAVAAARVHKTLVLLTLRGVDDVQAAQAMRGRVLYAARGELPLPPGRHFVADLVGLPVYDRRAGRVIGTLREVRELPAHGLYVVSDGAGEVLIPAVEVFLRGVDEAQGRIEVETIEGMLPGE